MNSSLLSDMFFAAPELWYSVFAVFAALIFWGAAEYVRLLQEKRIILYYPPAIPAR